MVEKKDKKQTNKQTNKPAKQTFAGKDYIADREEPGPKERFQKRTGNE